MKGVQVPAIVEHHIEIEIPDQLRPELQTLIVEPHVSLASLVGPNNGGVPARTAETHVPPFNDRYIAHAVFLCQEIGSSQTMYAAADHDRVVAGSEWGPLPQALESHG